MRSPPREDLQTLTPASAFLSGLFGVFQSTSRDPTPATSMPYCCSPHRNPWLAAIQTSPGAGKRCNGNLIARVPAPKWWSQPCSCSAGRLLGSRLRLRGASAVDKDAPHLDMSHHGSSLGLPAAALKFGGRLGAAPLGLHPTTAAGGGGGGGVGHIGHLGRAAARAGRLREITHAQCLVEQHIPSPQSSLPQCRCRDRASRRHLLTARLAARCGSQPCCPVASETA